jgi:exodeoxyribonuclease V alpha subunit
MKLDRARACMIHLFEQAVDQGHAYIAQEQLFDQCREAFDVGPENGGAAMDPTWFNPANWWWTRRMWMSPLVFPPDAPPGRNRDCPPYHGHAVHSPVRHATGQRSDYRRGAQTAVHHPVRPAGRNPLTDAGPQGVGHHRRSRHRKTTLIRSITAVMEGLKRRVMLAAPTGRAARRLSEVTGRPAATLHKALGYNLADGRFERTEDDPLAADVVVVDEASMVDTLLMAQLIRAVPVTATLILVGDVFQLPSVGPGNVLADLIRSRTIATFELTEIFPPGRTERHRGQRPPGPQRPAAGHGSSRRPDELSEFYFMEQADPERVVETVVNLCRREIPRHFRLDPIRDIQVLTPMHRGPVGTLNLNRMLQEALNTTSEQVEVMGSRFKVGDKVMHLRNNYRKEVFNGDIGIMHSVDPQKERAEVDYDGRKVPYEFIELDELTLAYAISVHKSQGSEYPAVVIPLLTQHYIMLQRNLLYTALTRGKQLVVMVGTTKALDVALKNDRPRQRRSMLARRLNPDLTEDASENRGPEDLAGGTAETGSLWRDQGRVAVTKKWSARASHDTTGYEPS